MAHDAGMSVSYPFWQGLSGFKMRCAVGSSLLTGSGQGATYSSYFQKAWLDDAAVAYRITKIGFKVGTALAAAGVVNVDLTALDSPDGGSGTISLAKVITAYIAVTSATGQLTIGNAASNAHALDFGAQTHTRILLPNGPGHLIGDYSGTGLVVDGTHKVVKLLNSHGSQAVDYIAWFGGQ